jgi:hypothetical protein
MSESMWKQGDYGKFFIGADKYIFKILEITEKWLK